MQQERRRQLLAILEKEHSASVHSLSARLYASEASVRRDVAALEKEGLVRRVYGGVLLSEYENAVVPLAVRDDDHAAAKELLARRAAAMVGDDETIFLDASSTVRRMVRHLRGRKGLTIITNNQRIFDELEHCEARVYCTGGEYSRENHVFAGPAAERFVRSVTADWLFFSSQGISEDGEVSDYSEQETSLRRAMIERSHKRVCLMDASKLGRRCAFSLCSREEIDVLLCDAKTDFLCNERNTEG